MIEFPEPFRFQTKTKGRTKLKVSDIEFNNLNVAVVQLTIFFFGRTCSEKF